MPIPYGVYPWQAYMPLGAGLWPTPGVQWVAAPSIALSGGSFMLLIWLSSQPFYLYCGTYSFRCLAESHPIPLSYLHGGEGSSLPGCVPAHDTVNSEYIVHVKPGDSSVVNGYQVDEFTHTWSAECFATWSHIYPGFTGKVSSLTLFPGCEDLFLFWTKQLKTWSMVLI